MKMYSNRIVPLMISMLELLLDKLVPIERNVNWGNSKLKTKESITKKKEFPVTAG